MNRIDKNDFFKEFLKSEAESKQNSEVIIEIDKSQFDFFEKPNYVDIEGLPLYVSAMLDARDTEQSIEDKVRPKQEVDLVEVAHPEPVIVAEPPLGGLVENQNEQHQAILNTVYKTPTTFALHGLAAARLELLKIAQVCEEQGFEEEADELTLLAAKVKIKRVAIDKCAGIMSAVWSFVGALMKNPAVAAGGATAAATALSSLGALVFSEAGLIAIAIIAGVAISWTLVDGYVEDIWIDTDQLLEKLNAYKSDPSFSSLPSLGEMILICTSISSELKKFKVLTETAKSAGDISKAKDIAESISKIDVLFDDLKASFAVFSIQAPKSWLRDITSFDFEDINGRIGSILKQYDDLRRTFSKSNAIQVELNRTQSSPLPPSAQRGSDGGIKEWLRSNDVSGIIGYSYKVSDGADIDAETRKVTSDFAEAIRSHLGTKYPSTQQLLSANYMGVENVYQIYEEPYSFME